MQFRIASIFLTRESEILRHYILRASAVTNGAPRETSLFPGIGDGCTPPYIIAIPPEEGVSADDFAQLCGVLFNPYVFYQLSWRSPRTTKYLRKYSIYEYTLDEWETLLRLACQWRFPELKKLALQKIYALGGGKFFCLLRYPRLTLLYSAHASW